MDDPDDPTPEPSRPPVPARSTARRLRLAAAAILAIGIAAAGLIYATAPDSDPDDPAARIASGRLYEYNIERIGGRAAVYAARFDQWLGSLWHGRRLAWTVAVGSAIAALGCLGLAGRLADPAEEDPGSEG